MKDVGRLAKSRDEIRASRHLRISLKGIHKESEGYSKINAKGVRVKGKGKGPPLVSFFDKPD